MVVVTQIEDLDNYSTIKNEECRISVGSLLKVFLLLEGLDPRRRFFDAPASRLAQNDRVNDLEK